MPAYCKIYTAKDFGPLMVKGYDFKSGAIDKFKKQKIYKTIDSDILGKREFIGTINVSEFTYYVSVSKKNIVSLRLNSYLETDLPLDKWKSCLHERLAFERVFNLKVLKEKYINGKTYQSMDTRFVSKSGYKLDFDCTYSHSSLMKKNSKLILVGLTFKPDSELRKMSDLLVLDCKESHISQDNTKSNSTRYIFDFDENEVYSNYLKDSQDTFGKIKKVSNEFIIFDNNIRYIPSTDRNPSLQGYVDRLSGTIFFGDTKGPRIIKGVCTKSELTKDKKRKF